jgi:N-hydroxyarylamine O-acetyltransferase
VYRRRGDHCYEHGLLFSAALERLGYSVERLLARVGGDGGPPRARTHMILRVRIQEENWLADTGFGSGLLEPISFEEALPQAQDGWTYDLLAAGNHSWQLRERQGSSWATLYSFDDQRQHASDVVMANHFTSTYPSSSFVRQLVVIRKDRDGLRWLTGRRLTTTRPGHPNDEQNLNDSEFADVLRQIFGLPFSADEITHLTRATHGRQ